MLLFFYGQDGFRSHEALRELKCKHVDASLGDTNLSHLDTSQVSVDGLVNALLAPPFLAKTRLVVLDRLLSSGTKAIQEKFLELVDRLPDSTVAVVYEPGIPDRRTVLWKRLQTTATTTEFTPLVGRALQIWMDQQLAPFEVTIETPAATKLEARCGGDTWRLATELAKLGAATLAQGRATITQSLVVELVRDTQSAGDFALSNALATGHPNTVLRTLRTLIRDGEAPQLLVGQVAATLRTLALIRDALDHGQADQRSIATATGLNPFVAGKHLPLARQLNAATIARLVTNLALIDLDSKRGKIEAEVGLELFLLKVTAQPSILFAS